MADYRFYVISAHNRVLRAEEHDCADDGAACSRAAAILFLISDRWIEAVEVWQRARKIAVIRRDDIRTDLLALIVRLWPRRPAAALAWDGRDGVALARLS
jgi:hypothetical protein